MSMLMMSFMVIFQITQFFKLYRHLAHGGDVNTNCLILLKIRLLAEFQFGALIVV